MKATLKLTLLFVCCMSIGAIGQLVACVTKVPASFPAVVLTVIGVVLLIDWAWRQWTTR